MLFAVAVGAVGFGVATTSNNRATTLHAIAADLTRLDDKGDSGRVVVVAEWSSDLQLNKR